jgi:hypothetical protein
MMKLKFARFVKNRLNSVSVVLSAVISALSITENIFVLSAFPKRNGTVNDA